MTRDEALKLRAIVEKAAESLDNKTAFEGKALFPNPKEAETFWDGHLVATGTRIRWKGELKFAMNDLWAYASNNPDNAPSLWETIEYRDGYRVLNGPISASNPVHPGEKCWEGEKLYECISLGVNTYRPSEYIGNWKEVAE